jgi:hypothetical protein
MILREYVFAWYIHNSSVQMCWGPALSESNSILYKVYRQVWPSEVGNMATCMCPLMICVLFVSSLLFSHFHWHRWCRLHSIGRHEFKINWEQNYTFTGCSQEPAEKNSEEEQVVQSMKASWNCYKKYAALLDHEYFRIGEFWRRDYN